MRDSKIWLTRLNSRSNICIIKKLVRRKTFKAIVSTKNIGIEASKINLKHKINAGTIIVYAQEKIKKRMS